MDRYKILIPGASSLTGYWFARKLVEQGHETVCIFTKPLKSYDGIRGKRVSHLNEITRCEFGIEFGSEEFFRLLKKNLDIDLFCFHFAHMENYKELDFDFRKAFLASTERLQEFFKAMQGTSGRAIVYTGTVFEPGEGAGSDDLAAFSPYGVTKTAIYEFLKFFARKYDIRLGKFIIPNPFGPLEEPKYTAMLMNAWKKNEVPVLKFPRYVRDNIHVSLLGELYADFCKTVLTGEQSIQKISPSQYAETMLQFTERIQREVRKRTQLECEFKVIDERIYSEPMNRVNTDIWSNYAVEWSEAKAWDEFVDYYCGRFTNKSR